ncbi:PIG-L family deacetylase [Hymenobacter aerilatus]|uniref:PIG-L family deacetylase n=1 Tax=Hymenobacter aerilatus TaxID=2932251 RepID=A0A8T9SV79_9BACT|nr:PIG-L family deacetylase [Hymenobacter aerilatus]UOR05988.1 PIG-L family deacetylase [Hymenobacter aerilatus]
MLLSRLCAALLAVLLASSVAPSAKAQAPKTWSSSEILLGLKKLNVLGSAMYIAAHPDDENTRFLAYLANGRLLETSYLSCTRGDGGQDLIGPEIREQLGLIRTQELLAARRIDGAHQFFTRANDFGFSKTWQETFTIWDKEQVLADMVWVIRQRRPDVLFTRFPPDPRAGHGHHQASAILAAEAFDAAGDPKRFPEQLKHVKPWQPKRLLWNTGSFFVKPGEDMSGYLKVDAGGYNALLGRSYGEIAAESRSQHRSQGFGSAAQRGEALEYLQPVKGDKAKTNPFEGIDQTWNRVPGGASVGKLVEKVIKEYDAANPAASVVGLIDVYNAMLHLQVDERARSAKGANTGVSLDEKLILVKELIKACSGIYMEAVTSTPTIGAGTDAIVEYSIVNRSKLPLKLLKVRTRAPHLINTMLLDCSVTDAKQETILSENKQVTGKLTLPGYSDFLLAQPYWLREPASIGMYRITGIKGVDSEFQELALRGEPENPPMATASFDLSLDGKVPLFFSVPVQYKHTDPVLGERYQPLAVVPPVAVNIAGKAYVFADNQPKTVPVTLVAGKDNVRGNLALQVPAGWQCEPASVPFELKAKGTEQLVQFQVKSTSSTNSEGQLRATATVDGQAYSRGLQTIEYPHIPTQTLFPEAIAPLVRVDLVKKGNNIGYIMGAGDEVPDALRQIGYTVSLLKADEVTPEALRHFDAVLLGVRAYNTVERLRVAQPVLLDYVKNGGNLIVQYVVSRGVLLPEIGPYPLTLSTDRVTVENAPVKFLNPKAPILNTPNKITTKDFEGWVQEQGLYYPSKWDSHYQTVISSHDPGETDKESAILVADYGKGHYIYTGLSLFRELPAGVPGAYRILANMISLGK